MANNNGKRVIIWDVDPHSWAAKLCQKVHRNLTLEEWRRFVGEREYEKTCPQFLSGLTLARLQEGEDLATKAELPNVEAAIAKFQEAFALDPELQKHPFYRFNPEVEVKKIAAPAWVSKGESLARKEKLDDAIAAFKRAQALDASLKFDPQTKANQSWASALVDKGESLASEEKLDDAIAAFKHAQALDASLKFDPQTKANQLVAAALVNKGESLASEEKLDDAIAAFKQALALDASLKFDPQTKANQSLASALMRKGKIDEAIAQYTKAQQLDPHLQVDAEQWNSLCWSGATYQQAAKVMEACEKAVALDPQNFQYRDSRGLARALTGNVTGAIEDFQFFVEKTEDADRKAQRQRWIEALRKGENPFTAEVLKELRGQ
jgi:tetratricopeptide (TPR) repeat protein